jgi:Tol biopolymer transport system component
MVETTGKVRIVRKPSDGSGAEETLLTLGPEISAAMVVDWSPDGRYLSYDAYNLNEGRRALWILPLFGDRKSFQCAPSVAGNQFDGNFSPDGHWLAYFSDETGQPEVYIVPFPGPGGKYQISQKGGWLVRWDKKGDLFFLTTGNQVIKAELNLGPQSLQVKSLRPLFQMNLADVPAPLFERERRRPALPRSHPRARRVQLHQLAPQLARHAPKMNYSLEFAAVPEAKRIVRCGFDSDRIDNVR